MSGSAYSTMSITDEIQESGGLFGAMIEQKPKTVPTYTAESISSEDEE